MKKVVFTAHAKDRCHEYEFDYRQLKKNFKTARKTIPPIRVKKINWQKHNRAARRGVRYKWAFGVLFTYVTKGNADIILTVTPKDKSEVKFAT